MYKTQKLKSKNIFVIIIATSILLIVSIATLWSSIINDALAVDEDIASQETIVNTQNKVKLSDNTQAIPTNQGIDVTVIIENPLNVPVDLYYTHEDRESDYEQNFNSGDTLSYSKSNQLNWFGQRNMLYINDETNNIYTYITVGLSPYYTCEEWKIVNNDSVTSEGEIINNTTISTNIIPYTGVYNIELHFRYTDEYPGDMHSALPLSNYKIDFYNNNNELLYDCYTDNDGIINIYNKQPSEVIGYFYAKVPGYNDAYIPISNSSFYWTNSCYGDAEVFKTEYSNVVIESQSTIHSHFNIIERTYDASMKSLIHQNQALFPSIASYEWAEYLYGDITILADGSLYMINPDFHEKNKYDATLIPISKDGTNVYKWNINGNDYYPGDTYDIDSSDKIIAYAYYPEVSNPNNTEETITAQTNDKCQAILPLSLLLIIAGLTWSRYFCKRNKTYLYK